MAPRVLTAIAGLSGQSQSHDHHQHHDGESHDHAAQDHLNHQL